VTIDRDPSARVVNSCREVEESLRAGRLDPRLLYVTARQAALWREVALRHSPVQHRPAFAQIYDEAFAQIAGRFSRAPDIALAGLGCGTGEKEARLALRLRPPPETRPLFFSAIDVSEDLVREASERLATAGAELRGSFVCDLGRVETWRPWLDERLGPGPRLLTFFGLVPNFTPSDLGRLLRGALRPGDLLLASAHLAPASGEDEAALGAAMEAVRPQYDNPETLAWLNAVRETWGLEDRIGAPEIRVGEVEGVAAFIGQAAWKTEQRTGPLRLFHSLRYTPRSFEELLRREGCGGERLALTPCREEGIWAVSLCAMHGSRNRIPQKAARE
jgi:SAM-dependent methyltransferase